MNIDYHVEVFRHYYSVPYQLRREEVDVRIAAKTIEILKGPSMRAQKPNGRTAARKEDQQ